ncbi:TPA: hypothetical protein EYP70_02920 [Candidatus Bathyarchaeota archaeon]|nr:hypothetical protein [Candidatus Bathyarchaeota archaeon]
MTWLRLDDPPQEDAGDVTMTMLVYGRRNVAGFYYSIWNGSTWSEGMEGRNVSTQIRWVVTATTPNRLEIIAGVLTDRGRLYVNVWNGSWGTSELVTKRIFKRR